MFLIEFLISFLALTTLGPIIRMLFGGPPLLLLLLHLGQTQTFGHFEKHINGIVHASENFRTGSLGPDGDVGEGVDALVVGCG